MAGAAAGNDRRLGVARRRQNRGLNPYWLVKVSNEQFGAMAQRGVALAKHEDLDTPEDGSVRGTDTQPRKIVWTVPYSGLQATPMKPTGMDCDIEPR